MRRPDRIALIALAVLIVIVWVVALFMSRGRASSDGYVWRRSRLPVSYYDRHSISANIVETRNGAIVVATDPYGVFRSTDGGRSWSRSGRGMKKCWVNDMVADRSGDIYAATGCGTYRSRDEGKSWALVHTMPNESTDLIAVDTHNNIYTLTSGRRLFISSDSGKHWALTNRDKINGNVHSFAVDSNGALYAGTGEYGIYRSTERDHPWRNLWKCRSDEYSVIRSLAVGPDGEIWAVDDQNLLHSSDRGKHWNRVSPKLTNILFRAVALSPKGEVFAGGDGGGFISRDRGRTWEPMGMRTGSLFIRRYTAITAFAFGKSGRVYAANDVNDVFVGTPVKSKD